MNNKKYTCGSGSEQEGVPDFSRSNNNSCVNIISLISTCENSYLSKLTIQGLSEYFGYNRCYLSTKFKKETQMLLSDFIKNEKLHRALRILLTRDNVHISYVSKELGFNKAAYFRKIFREKYGFNPSNFKNSSKPNIKGS